MSRQKTVLVTGASGQLGRRLVKELLKHNYNVKAHYRTQKKADRYCFSEVTPVFGDIIKPDWLNDAVKGCDIVIHCAAKVSVRPMRDSSYMYQVNVEGTRAVVDACKNSDVKRLLHVSSVAAVGGSNNSVPLDEKADFNLAGYGLPYFETKRKAELLALGANDTELEVVVVNPSIMISMPDRKLTEEDIKKIPKRIPVYFDFGINLVETADVVDGIIKSLEKGRPGERYILAGDNLNPYKTFKLAEKYFKIKKPLIKIPFTILFLLGCLSELAYIFKDKKPKLNRNIVRLLKLKLYYSSEKACKELGYAPKSIEKTMEHISTMIKQ